MKERKSKKLKVPKQIFAQVSPKSIGGRSLFSESTLIDKNNVKNYFSERKVIKQAAEYLKNQGFNVLQITNTTINVSGSKSIFRRAFGKNIIPRELETMKNGPEKDYVTYLDCPDTDHLGLIKPKSGESANYIEGVAIETPYYYFTPNIFPPKKDYWHLQVPGDVSLGCNSDKAHRIGITGKGIKVAMVDSGFYKHPFFTSRGYRFSKTVLGPGTSNPEVDLNGHGTSEAANIFSNAPDCKLLPVKMSFVNSTAAFNTAVALNPDIITCSWGQSILDGPLTPSNQALAAAIAVAVSSNITVIFSAGNGHYGFPGQHPDVISSGGAYMNIDSSLEASNYSSGFVSQIYNNRVVPDVCGLVGQRPHAAYIMLPLQQNSEIDVGISGGQHPNGDETDSSDGWAAISGTSAAAPQLAGVAALIKQVCPTINPVSVKKVMKHSATDLKEGSNAQGNKSVIGPDNSTGHGLVNAYKAVLLSKLRCPNTLPDVIDEVKEQPIKIKKQQFFAEKFEDFEVQKDDFLDDEILDTLNMVEKQNVDFLEL